MDKRDKLYELHGLFNRARGTLLTKHQLLSNLECSESTLKRRIKDLQDIYGAPLEYDQTHHGWRYQKGVSFELPSLLMVV